MKCLILAAGYATRLYPLTENFPKPLLEVRGKTILDWLVDDIDTAGLIDEYVVISNHKYAHHFEAWAKTKPVMAGTRVFCCLPVAGSDLCHVIGMKVRMPCSRSWSCTFSSLA